MLPYFILESLIKKRMQEELKSNSEILKTLMISRILDIGWGNGYVILPPEHKYHGVDYNDIPVSVHGGLTFGRTIDDDFIEGIKEEYPDIINYKGHYVVGFDTAHFNDNSENWTKDRVEQETYELANKLEKLNI